MARKKKNSNENTIPRNLEIKLDEIASRLGTTVNDLLESYGDDPQLIIEKFDTGKLRMINE